MKGEAGINIGQVLVNGYQEYVTQEGDAYDVLAIDFYDDEMMASYIIQALSLIHI